MGFVTIDGFDDREWIQDSGENPWPDDYLGFGLYNDMYCAPWGEPGSHPDTAWGEGYACAQPDYYMSYGLVQLTHGTPTTPATGQKFSGGMRVNSIDGDATVCFGAYIGAPNKYGPIIEFSQYGNIEVKRTRQSASTIEVIAMSTDTALATMWGWHYVTFQFELVSIGNDWIKVWVDGKLVIDLTNTTLNYGATHSLTGIDAPSVVDGVDDLWLRDDLTVYTEPRIFSMFPDGAGTYTQCNPINGPDNWDNVDGWSQDIQAYNEATTGEKDSFTIEPLSDKISAGGVKGLAVRWFVYGDGASQIRPFVIVSGSKYNGTAQTPSAKWQYVQHIWENNPHTGSAWTIAELDAVECGYEVL